MGLACPSGLSPSPSRAPRPRSSASRQGKAPSRHHLLQPVICECSLSWVQVTPSPCMNAGPPSTGSHFFLFRRRCGSSCHISVPPREVPTCHPDKASVIHSFVHSTLKSVPDTFSSQPGRVRGVVFISEAPDDCRPGHAITESVVGGRSQVMGPALEWM